MARFSSAGLPSSAEEIWRYSRIDDLDLDAFELSDAGDAVAADVGVGVGTGSGDPAARVDILDGWVSSVELSASARAAGLSVRRLSELTEAPGGVGGLAEGADAFVDMATAMAPDALLIEVPAGKAIDGPVLVTHRLRGGGRATASRTLVRAGRASQVSVIETLVSDESVALHVPVVELWLDEAANVDYAGLQLLGRSAWCLGHQVSQVGRDATLRSLSVALGGDYARLRTDSRLTGAGGSTRLLALYFGEGTQMHDFRTLQDHSAPKTTSDLLFKGAVQDEANGVYSGLIRVRRGAVGTNAFQTNRNLVLAEGATAWSVPNLEIEENDVRCSHASAVGPVDEEQMYYLQSRGIRPEVAERLIVLGFFDDLLVGAPAPALHPTVRRMVSDKLQRHLASALPRPGAA
ncbi:MAG: Fe-S cluster assembly protein SufD [Acidimicrobiales bacterium]